MTVTTADSALPYCASNWLRKTLNSCTASCDMLIVGTPWMTSSMSPPSMIVVNELRWSAAPPNFVVAKRLGRWSGAALGSSCASVTKFRSSTGSDAICSPTMAAEGCDLATSTSGTAPDTVTSSFTPPTPSRKSIVASAPMVRVISRASGVKPGRSATTL